MTAYKSLDAPLSVHVELNTGCNHTCFHCYNYWRGDAPAVGVNLTPALVDRIVDQLRTHRVLDVTLNGGEPLLNFAVLCRLAEQLRAAEIPFGLNSNLTLLTSERAERLAGVGVRTILTSILSSDEVAHDRMTNAPGSFRKLLAGVRAAHDAGIEVVAHMVVMSSNLDHVRPTAAFVASLGITRFAATRVQPPRTPAPRFLAGLALTPAQTRSYIADMVAIHDDGMSVDSLVPYPVCFLDDEGARVLGFRSCSAGVTSAVIGADGVLRACPQHEASYGSIGDEALDVLWQRMQPWRDGSMLPQACLDCSAFALCGGGCRVASPATTERGLDDLACPDAVDTIPFRHVHRPLMLDAGTRLRVRSTCVFRRDTVLGIASPRAMRPLLLEHPAFDLLQGLHAAGATFTPASLQQERDIRMEEAPYLRFLDDLLARDVLEVVA